MTSLDFTNFSETLRVQVPGFDRVFREHIQDYDEVLPHVLVAELARFLSADVQKSGSLSAALPPAMDILERGMASNDPKLQELVAVSFLENLDPADASFQEIRRHFGPHMRKQFERYWP
jgi:hypothetical protein